MIPRSHAIAFRVWAHCTPIGWNCTIAEAAEAVGETTHRVRKIVTDKGWADRFRAASRYSILDKTHVSGFVQ